MKKFLALLITFAMILCMLPFSALADSTEYETITVDEVKTVSIAAEGDTVYFRFVPPEDGHYVFTSYSEKDTFGLLLDEEFNGLSSDDDSGDDMNFLISAFMQADTVYYLGAKFLNEEQSGIFEVEVSKAPEVDSISIQESVRIYVDDYFRLDVTAFPNGSFPENLTWSSNDESVVEVSDDGVVHGISAGTANVSVRTENRLSATCAVTVCAAQPLTVEVPQTVTITNNHEEQYCFTPAENGTYLFAISDYSNDNIGYIYTIGNNWNGRSFRKLGARYYASLIAGTTYLIGTLYDTYSNNESSGSYTITVSKCVPATGLTISPAGVEGFIDTFFYLTPLFTPWNGAAEDITWSSDNGQIATVDSNGMITMFEPGTALITATTESGLSATCPVTVKDYESIAAGETKTVTISEAGKRVSFWFTPEESGCYMFTSSGSDDTRVILYDAEGEYLDEDDDSGIDNNFKLKYEMEAGVKYRLDFGYYGNTVGSFPVTAAKINPMTALEVESLPTRLDYIEGCSPSEFDFRGLVLKATLADGSVTYWNYRIGQHDLIGDEEVTFNTNETPETGIVQIQCGDYTTEFSVRLASNPVDHLEVVTLPSHAYFENVEGYTETIYLEELDQYDSFFCYYTQPPHDAIIRIVFKDGTEKTAHVGDTIDGYTVEWTADQEQDHWYVGTENISTVTYLGVSVTLPITVRENLLESMELVSGSMPTLYENGDGYWSTYYDRATGTEIPCFIYYYDEPEMIFRLRYSDGTSRIVTNKQEIDKGYWIQLTHTQLSNPWTLGSNNYVTARYLNQSVEIPVTIVENPVTSITINSAPSRTYIIGDPSYGWLNENGDYYLEPRDLTGLAFTVYYQDGSSRRFSAEDEEDSRFDGHFYTLNYTNDPVTPGELAVTFEYLGQSVNYTVSVQPSSVRSLQILRLPDKTEYSPYYLPNWSGLSFRVNYTNGTSEIITLPEEQSYQYGFNVGAYYVFETNQGDVIIHRSYEYNNAEETIVYNLSYLGCSVPIEGITFSEKKPIAQIDLEHFTPQGDGMTVLLTYEDGTTETVPLLDILYYHEDQYNGVPPCVIAKTANGILEYYVHLGDDNSYYLWIFGKELIIDDASAIPGDLNRDGTVNAQDLLTLKLALLFRTAKTYDLNEDGEFDLLDLVALKKLLVGLSANPGDANGDGILSEEDVEVMQALFLDPSKIDRYELARCDLNHDGVANTLDLIALKKSLSMQ